MEQQKLEKGLLNFTAGLVSLFTLILAINLLSFKPAAKANSDKSRTPASVAPHLNLDSKVQQHQLKSLSEEVQLPCLSDGLVHNLNSPLSRLRIGSELCKNQNKINESLIVNKTNGFIATVFYLTAHSFTTDLIDLSPGANHIHISHHLADGTKVISEIVITH